MIVITGASGFIGSCLIKALNESGHNDLILVDEFMRADKRLNLEGIKYKYKIERHLFLDFFEATDDPIDFVYHLGARTDTTEMNEQIFDKLNVNYTKKIWQICTTRSIPLVYASSAATYGGGEHGYDDDHEVAHKLHPLNPYGWSKQEFDLYALSSRNTPPFWAGIKFFNVFGPNEYHKGRMASVVYHAYNQIRDTGRMKLFRSHRPGIDHGQQSRDFIYIKDVIFALKFFRNYSFLYSGLYNLGTGRARSFMDLCLQVFKSLDMKPNIEFIDTPMDIREKYQYYTQANIEKLRMAGYEKDFYTLEEGVADYVQHYLHSNTYY